MLPLEPYDLNGFAGGPTHTYTHNTIISEQKGKSYAKKKKFQHKMEEGNW